MLANLLKEAKGMHKLLTAHRRYLHTHAETGFHLPKTWAYVNDTLTGLGYRPQKVGRCGMTATIGSGEPVCMLRADLDALAVQEASGLPFAAQNGNAHLCGHDLHTAMLLGAAALIKKHEKELQGSVVLMFQPAEELLAGAADMIADGLLDDPKPNCAMMIHVMNAAGLKPGTVIVPPAGASAPAADFFQIRIQGKGCHGAMPHTGVDPINAGAHLVLALQAISAREFGLSDPHALTITCFQAGGSANVFPEHALLKGSVRSYDLKTQQHLKKRIEEITKRTAETFRATAKVEWLNGCPTLLNHPKLANEAQQWLTDLLGSEQVLSAEQLGGSNARSVGSEDFSYISQKVPSLMLALAAGGCSDAPLHHPKIVFNEAALPYGAAVYAAFALSRGDLKQL